MVVIVNLGPISLLITVTQLAMSQMISDDNSGMREQLFPNDWETTSQAR